MIRYLIILVGILLANISFAQDSVWVHVTVLSKTERETVQNVRATINIGSNIMFESTNMKGQFWFKAVAGDGIDFRLSHVQFASTESFKRIPKNATDTVSYEFEMVFLKTKELNEVYVSAPGVAKTVFESKRLHVADFEILPDGNFLLLTYPKRLDKGSELLIYDGQRTLTNFQVPHLAKELIHDFRGNAHVVCENMIYGILYDGTTVGISQVPKEYYMTYIAPILDTNATRMYFSNFNPDYPAFNYFSYDQMDSTYKKILEIEDEFMMEMYRAEYKWSDVRTQLWAKNLELQTGIDAEIYVGANYFTQSIYYKEVYAPLFHRNDSLFVFDYYKDKLFTYDKVGNAIDSVGIYHHYNPKSTGWEKQLIQDKVTGHIYAIYERAGYSYLGHIDMKTGEITEQVRLKHRYVDKIEVQNNAVYYIYREFESIDKRMLWTEQLPYKYRKAKTLTGDETEALNN